MALEFVTQGFGLIISLLKGIVGLTSGLSSDIKLIMFVLFGIYVGWEINRRNSKMVSSVFLIGVIAFMVVLFLIAIGGA